MPHHLRLLPPCSGWTTSRRAQTVAEALNAERNLESWCNAEIERERGALLLLTLPMAPARKPLRP
jgi:hypothetical protein